MMMSAPWSASPIEIARPSPRLPPVTSATLPPRSHRSGILLQFRSVGFIDSTVPYYRVNGGQIVHNPFLVASGRVSCLSLGMAAQSAFETHIGFLIHEVSRKRKTHFDRMLKPVGITRAQLV